MVARAANRAFGKVLGTVLLERLIDLVALAVLVLVASMFAPVPVLVVGVAAVTLAIGIAGGLVLGVVGQRLGGAVSASPVGLRQRAAAFGRHLLAGALYPGRGVIMSAGALSLVAWMLDAGLYLAAAASLGITLQLGTAVIIGAAGALATVLPAAPGYVGTYDLAAAAVGAGLGLDPATAVALAAVVHVVALVPIALAGAAALVSETVSGRSVRFFGACGGSRRTNSPRRMSPVPGATYAARRGVPNGPRRLPPSRPGAHGVESRSTHRPMSAHADARLARSSGRDQPAVGPAGPGLARPTRSAPDARCGTEGEE